MFDAALAIIGEISEGKPILQATVSAIRPNKAASARSNFAP